MAVFGYGVVLAFAGFANVRSAAVVIAQAGKPVVDGGMGTIATKALVAGAGIVVAGAGDTVIVRKNMARIDTLIALPRTALGIEIRTIADTAMQTGSAVTIFIDGAESSVFTAMAVLRNGIALANAGILIAYAGIAHIAKT